MHRSVFLSLFAFVGMAFHASSGQVVAPDADTRLQHLKDFIQSAPKATEKSDCAYAIKLRIKDRQEAVRQCDEITAADPTNIAPRRIREELCMGEGFMFSIAEISATGNSIPPELGRIGQILNDNLIDWNCTGTRGWDISVSLSHAARASSLIASLVLKEHLHIALFGRNGTLNPEDALKEYEKLASKVSKQ